MNGIYGEWKTLRTAALVNVRGSFRRLYLFTWAIAEAGKVQIKLP